MPCSLLSIPELLRLVIYAKCVAARRVFSRVFTVRVRGCVYSDCVEQCLRKQDQRAFDYKCYAFMIDLKHP